MAELLEMAKRGEVHLLTTQITIDECHRRILEGVQEAVAEKQKLDIKKAWAFKRLPEFELLLKPSNVPNLATQLIQSFDSYLKEATSTCIDLKLGSLDEVVDQYLAKAPPFGPGKKTLEFPDAIVLSALNAWCKKQKCVAYVISRDGRYLKACEPLSSLHPLDDLGKFLDLVNKPRRAAAAVSRAFIARESDIIGYVSDDFVDLGFYLSSEVEGDVEDVSVSRVVLGQPNIISVDDEQATLELECEVTFSAEVSYEDPNTGAWDSEDKVFIMMDTDRKSIDRTVYVMAQLLFEYPSAALLEDPDEIVISLERLNGGEPVSVKFDPWR